LYQNLSPDFRVLVIQRLKGIEQVQDSHNSNKSVACFVVLFLVLFVLFPFARYSESLSHSKDRTSDGGP